MPSASGNPTADNPGHAGTAPHRRGFDALRAAIAAPNADGRAAALTTALRRRFRRLPVRSTAATAPLDGRRADTTARPAIPAAMAASARS